VKRYFRVVFEAGDRDGDPMRGLRQTLKYAGRSAALRCIRAVEVDDPDDPVGHEGEEISIDGDGASSIPPEFEAENREITEFMDRLAAQDQANLDELLKTL